MSALPQEINELAGAVEAAACVLGLQGGFLPGTTGLQQPDPACPVDALTAPVADVVIASSQMKLRTGYAAIGLSPDVGASYFLARRVGAMRAQRWLMLSTPISAEECLQAGAVDALYAPDALPQAADEWIQRLLHAAPASMAYSP